MEISLAGIGNKEKKKGFFRKTGSGSSSSGSSSRGHNSWESSSLQSPTTATTSLEGPGTTTPLHGSRPGSPKIQTTPARGTSLRSNTSGGSLDEQCMTLPPEQFTQVHGRNSSGFGHRRFMGAPRRARSAERFDGMRIHSSPGGGSGDKHIHLSSSPRSELLNNNNTSTANNNTSSNKLVGRSNNGSTMGPFNSVSQSIPAGSGIPISLSTSGIASPPPPYQAAITEKSGGPPTYRQAVAAAAASSGKPRTLPLHPRHVALTRGSDGPTSQSLDHATMSPISTVSSRGSNGSNVGLGRMRSAVSVPTFTADVICNCSKCQIQRDWDELNCGHSSSSVADYNDSAVYMESQAFLMHEIMTDGMAFCSIC